MKLRIPVVVFGVLFFATWIAALISADIQAIILSVIGNYIFWYTQA